MKAFLRDNKLLLIAVAVCLIACFAVIGTRASVESKNKTYDIVLDYNEIEAMAEQSDQDVSWWLSQFKDMGITKVGVTEENIVSMMEDARMPVTGTVMDVLAQDAAWRSNYPQEFIAMIEEKGFDSYDVLVEVESPELTAFVMDGIRARFAEDKYFIYETENAAYAMLDGTADVTLYTEGYKYMNSKKGGFSERIDIVSSKLMYISLGLLPEKVEAVQALGMDVIPRTMSYNGWNGEQYANAVLDGYAQYDIVPEYIIVGGEAVIGHDDSDEIAKDYIVENGVTIGLIEDTTQLQNIMQYGVEDVAIASGYDTVRVFSVWNYIQYRYQYYGYEGAEEIENTLFRAVTERNVRVIYFKPFMQTKDLHTYITDVGEYEKMFDNLEQRLERHGFTYGSASVMDDYQVSKTFKMIFAWGCVFAAVLLLRGFLPLPKKAVWILTILGVLAVPAAFFVMPNTSELIASFAAAVIFACLGVSYYTLRAKQCEITMDRDTGLLPIIKAAVFTLLIAVAITLLGGLMTAAPISSVNYMLEIDIFRGVKLAQLLPIAYFIVAYLAYFGYGKLKTRSNSLEFKDLKDLFNASIKVWMILIGAIIAGVGVYYIMRTGHESTIEVSSLEMIFRNELEELLMARPRTKEFLIAFPAIMMMVYCAVRKLKMWSILFGLAGVLGMTSVCNTFMHIRTPLYLGFIRTGYSLLFGIVLGIIAILIFEGLYRLYNKYCRKYVEA